MKRLLAALIIILAFGFAGQVYAATDDVTTCTRQSLGLSDNKVHKIAVTCTWTSDSSAGTVTKAIAAATYGLHGYILYSLETNPGSTAPTADYDITVTDADGLDMCAGNAADRHTSTTQMVTCASSTQPYSVVRGNITLNISAAGNSKQGTATLMFLKD